MIKITKKKYLALAATIATLGVIGGATIMAQPSKTGADTSPVITELDNHEVRIRNNENDIRTLQTATNTSPNPTNTSVPAVTAPVGQSTDSTGATAPTGSTSPAPAAAVVVTAFKEIVIDPDTSDCEYTYSDDTTSVFHWKTTNQQGSWVTDSSGQNGHWVKAVNKMGFCDNRALGQAK